MNIFITGGVGFVGSALTPLLVSRGHEVTLAARHVPAVGTAPAGVVHLGADLSVPGPWQETLGAHDCVINLAGLSIFTRWTARTKRDIRQSRVSITANVVRAVALSPRVKTLVSASAVGYYGFTGDEELGEDAPPGNDFLAGVCRDWEREALSAERSGMRVVIARLGVVLGKNGGALDLLEKIFRFRLGSRLGGGGQWFSWIHASDLARAITHVIDTHEMAGPVNLTAPRPVTNRELTAALNRAMGTFALVPPAPPFALRLALGEFGDFLLKGQRAVPAKLLSSGFSFAYPGIDAALKDLLR